MYCKAYAGPVKNKQAGFEGDCAEQGEVKTVRWTVFKESVEEVYDYKHTATSGVGVICTVKHTPTRLKINGRDSKATVPRNFRFYFAMII